MRRSLDRKYAARDSNMELARIISMILITVGHFVLLFGMCQPPDSHFISSADISSVPAYIPHIALYSLCIVGVSLFILISGFFQIKLTWKGLFHYIALCVFYNALTLLADWLFADAFSVAKLIKVFIVSKTVNWFFCAYFWLMLVSPILNAGLSSLSLPNLRRCVLILFILNCVSGFLFHNQNLNGFNAYQFFFLYIVGSWIRKDPAISGKGKSFYVCLYLAACLIMSMIAVGMLRFTTWSLDVLYTYNNPLTVIAAVALFIFFTKLSFKSSLINRIASTVVAALFVQLIVMRVFASYINTHPAWYIPVYILVIFVIAFIIEYPRKQLTESLLVALSRKKCGAFISRPIISETSKQS